METTNLIVTINRELGSGGRTVGKLLAERLGVKFYDKALWTSALSASWSARDSPKWRRRG